MRVLLASMVISAATWLTACGGGGSTTAAQPSAPLADTSWINDSGHTLEFKGSDVINGFAGCNTYLGQAVVEQTRITLKPQASTVMSCGDDPNSTGQVSSIMDSEDRFFRALRATTQWRISANRLVLLDAQSIELLTFKPKSSSGG